MTAAAASGSATWQCPHCGARQAEAGRCWVCHRSTTCCATCANFRRSLAAGIGYCGLDRTRSPLRGDELRGCWVARSQPQIVTLLGRDTDVGPRQRPSTSPPPRRGVDDDRPHRDWVPVEDPQAP